MGERLTLNMGPSHPSTHGVLRIVLELDGEVITKATPHIGYLHRGDEKIAENMQYNQFVPYTDRLDYLAPIANNVAYALAVEKLMGWELPPRGKAIRVICCELARISSHLVGVGCMAMDLGATTVFLYTFYEREKIYNLFELLTGARFTTNYTRVGGQTRDLPEPFIPQLREFLTGFKRVVEEVDKLLTRNRIFIDSCKDVGVISKQRQSERILEQVLEKLPLGPVNYVDPKQTLPPKVEVLTKMEELIHHFILVTEGVDAPVGEVYFAAENPKGELGFYISSKGGGVPYRLKIRAPSFVNLSILAKVLPGHMISDVVCVLGSFDFVMGECDR